MVGKYEIEVYNNKVHYFLTIKRNITILQGDSATGKTELIRLIQERQLPTTVINVLNAMKSSIQEMLRKRLRRLQNA